MILGIQRVQGQELSNLASVNTVAFRGSEQGFKQLMRTLDKFGVVQSEDEKAADQQNLDQDFVDTLLNVLPVKAAENG